MGHVAKHSAGAGSNRDRSAPPSKPGEPAETPAEPVAVKPGEPGERPDDPAGSVVVEPMDPAGPATGACRHRRRAAGGPADHARAGEPALVAAGPGGRRAAAGVARGRREVPARPGRAPCPVAGVPRTATGRDPSPAAGPPGRSRRRAGRPHVRGVRQRGDRAAARRSSTRKPAGSDGAAPGTVVEEADLPGRPTTDRTPSSHDDEGGVKLKEGERSGAAAHRAPGRRPTRVRVSRTPPCCRGSGDPLQTQRIWTTRPDPRGAGRRGQGRQGRQGKKARARRST